MIISVESTLTCRIDPLKDIKGSISELGGLKTDPTMKVLFLSDTFTNQILHDLSYGSDPRS